MTEIMTELYYADLVNSSIADCDEAIANCESLVNKITTYKIVYKNPLEENKHEEEVQHIERARLLCLKEAQNCMKIAKTSKLIYIAVLKRNPDTTIFAILLAKFDELVCLSFEIFEEKVKLEVTPEIEYLEFCDKYKLQREHMVIVCTIGEREAENARIVQEIINKK